jgi:hypothetical protein
MGESSFLQFVRMQNKKPKVRSMVVVVVVVVVMVVVSGSVVVE